MKSYWKTLRMPILKERMESFIYDIKRRIKVSYSKSNNGYGTWMALVCFAFMIQVISFLNLYTLSNYQLYQANIQSTFDLSCFSQMKGMIQHNTRVRLCHEDEKNLITYKEMKIQNRQVQFYDCETYVDGIYQKGNRTIHIKVYYDDKGIKDYEFTEDNL